jgi:cation diffusion facilitator family transporter
VPSERNARIQRVLVIALVGNISSAILKVLFGLLANSIAMLADAVHSMFDSVSSVIGIYGNKLSAKPPDIEHPYGHSKFEQLAALGITVMIFVACFNILHEAIERAIANVIPSITLYSFVSILVSLSISLLISIYERRVGRSTSSIILLADSSHTLTDVFASLVVIAGFFGTNMGFLYADSLAATLVCLILAYVGCSLFKGAASMLVDRGITSDTLMKVKATVNGLSEEVECHNVRGKTVGDKIYIDMHITVKGDLSVEQSHRITEVIEKKLKQAIEGTEEVIIHVEPSRKPREKQMR